MAQAVQINPKILSWARETAGLSVEEAAEKLGLKNTAKASATEKLLQVEGGARPIGQGMLQKAAATYRRPLVAFYLAQPPERGERAEDFRTVAGAASPREDAMLDALIRDIRARQAILREVLSDDEDTRKLPFVASCKMSQGAKVVVANIRTVLGVSTADQRRAKDTGALFSLLRAAAERAGVYVLLLGDLGSHHSDIGEDVFRGVALADNIAPFVVINDNDAAPARSFTLLHELAHIWIGASGVSGPMRGVSENAIERFCNEVAGEFLLPPEALEKLATAWGADFDRAMSLTDDIARTWNVSQGVPLSAEPVDHRRGGNRDVPGLRWSLAGAKGARPGGRESRRQGAGLLHRPSITPRCRAARRSPPRTAGRSADPYESRANSGRRSSGGRPAFT